MGLRDQAFNESFVGRAAFFRKLEIKIKKNQDNSATYAIDFTVLSSGWRNDMLAQTLANPQVEFHSTFLIICEKKLFAVLKCICALFFLLYQSLNGFPSFLKHRCESY